MITGRFHTAVCLGLVLGAVVAAAPAAAAAAESPAAGLAREIVEKTGVRRGFCLDLGPGNGELAMGIARLTELRVHCVEPDPAAAQRLREKIDAAGLYGVRVSVEEGKLGKLDYPDYFANLILCSGGLHGQELKELWRVLNPNGAAFIPGPGARGRLESGLKAAGIKGGEIQEGAGGAFLRRPFDPGWDEWTHPNHDAANTFGSNDTTIRTADFRVHWGNRNHESLTGSKILMAGGRQFLTAREFPDGPPSAFPAVRAFDAFNGHLLWQRVGKKALPFDRSVRHYPPTRPCADVVATADRLYLLGGKLLHVLDAATGKTLASWPVPREAGAGAEDIWQYIGCEGNALYCAVGPSPNQENPGKYNIERGTTSALVSLERRTGKLRWATKAAALVTSVTVGGGRVYFVTPDRKLAALDAGNGSAAWENPEPGLPEKMPIGGNTFYQGKLWVLYAPGHEPGPKKRGDGAYRFRQARVYSAEDGKHLFAPAFEWARENKKATCDLTFSNGLAWPYGRHSGTAEGFLDLETGRRLAARQEGAPPGPSGHKCTPKILTPYCLFYRAGGPGVWVHAGKEKGRNRTYGGCRPTCWYPFVPAYGMLHVTAGGCSCGYPMRAHMAWIQGDVSFRPGRNDTKLKDTAGRLVKGPAFGGEPGAGSDANPWVTWRRDVKRSGITTEEAGTPLKQLWSRKFLDRVTPVTAVGKTAFFGSGEKKFYALDATTGRTRWQFFARGRVLAPPFWWAGRVYFGDEDGWAYCLRAEDGQLVWKFRAAPAQDRIVYDNRLTSRWPVGNGVLVDGKTGTAYLLAGLFSMYAKVAYALDARTGAVKWTRVETRATCSPRGTLALGKDRLYFTSEGGAPREIALDDPEHPFRHHIDYKWGLPSARGKQIAVVGDNDIISAGPRLGYVMQYYFFDAGTVLPVVTGDAIYGRNILTQSRGRPFRLRRKIKPFRIEHALRAEKRGAFDLRSCFSARRGGSIGLPDPKATLWEAWKGTLMTTVIKAGGTVFSGSKGKVHATGADDGKELWSAEVPGEPLDLAFADGRLLVVCDSGAVVCFGR